MNVFEHISFDAHEQVVFCHDPHTGQRVEGIAVTLDDIFRQADRARRSPNEVANQMAEQRLGMTPQFEEASHGSA